MTEPELVCRALGLTIREVNEEERSIPVVMSTATIDSYGDSVTQNWDLTRFKANPVCLYAHNSRELPIGRVENVKVTDKALEGTIFFASAKANPLAEQVFQLFKEKVLRAVSVGFLPHTVRYEKHDDIEVCVMDDNELYELSVTPVPANPEALAKMRARALAKAAASTTTAQPGAAPRGTTETHMPPSDTPTTTPNTKALEDLERRATAAEQRAATLETTEKAVVAERDAARTELTTAKASLATATEKAAALEATNKAMAARVVELELEPLLGVKILPTEKAGLLEIATLFAGQPGGDAKWKSHVEALKARPDLKILGGPVVGADPSPAVTLGSSPMGDGSEGAALVNQLAAGAAPQLPAA